MIFLDESGKRWKRIKHSTAGIALLGSLPVGVLVLGSLVYQPQWGLLPLVRQATGAVLSTSAKSQPNQPASTKSKTAPKTVQTAAQVVRQLAYQAAGAISASIPASTSVAAAPTANPVTPTPAQSVSPTSGNPAQNDYGQSHKPVK